MKRLAGFTIIELMITLALVAVILTVGVPAFKGLMERNRLTANINSFVSSLALARSEAVKRKQRVVVCASNDGSTCKTDNSGYETGWIVYVESISENGARDNGEELLWVNESLSSNITLRGNSAFQNNIQYVSTGRSNGNGSVFLCIDNSVSKARMVTIITSGRVHLAQNNSAGVPLDSSGTPVASFANCS